MKVLSELAGRGFQQQPEGVRKLIAELLVTGAVGAWFYTRPDHVAPWGGCFDAL
jgi:hypothetical protein